LKPCSLICFRKTLTMAVAQSLAPLAEAIFEADGELNQEAA
jgi:hypothetical protein